MKKRGRHSHRTRSTWLHALRGKTSSMCRWWQILAPRPEINTQSCMLRVDRKGRVHKVRHAGSQVTRSQTLAILVPRESATRLPTQADDSTFLENDIRLYVLHSEAVAEQPIVRIVEHPVFEMYAVDLLPGRNMAERANAQAALRVHVFLDVDLEVRVLRCAQRILGRHDLPTIVGRLDCVDTHLERRVRESIEAILTGECLDVQRVQHDLHIPPMLLRDRRGR